MKVVRNIALLLLGGLSMLACSEDKLDMPLVRGGQVVLDFSAGALTRGTSPSEEKEKGLNHLDVFIFESVAAGNDQGTSPCKYYGRHEANTQRQLSMAKELFETGKTYWVYVVANSTYAETDFEVFRPGQGNDLTLADLQVMIQEDNLVHLTSSGVQGAPAFFLMDGIAYAGASEPATKTAVTLNDNSTETDIDLKVTLRRAAAKMAVTFEAKTAADGAEIRFIHDVADITAVLPDYAEVASLLKHYYIENMRIDTKIVDGTLPVDEKLVSTRNAPTNLAVSADKGILSLATYTYSHDWATGGDEFSRESYIVARIPVLYKASAEAEWVVKADNYYKVTLGVGEKIDRNKFYNIKVAISHTGASSPTEAIALEGRYDVEEWVEQDINIGGDINKPAFLELSKETLTMRNRTEDHSIQFASSSTVTATIKEVYFWDKLGQQKWEYRGSGDIPHNLAVVPDAALNGVLTVTGDVPTNNLIRYVVVEIKNQDQGVEPITLLVKQYPLEYIQGVQGYYSYRDDFHNGNPDRVTTYEQGYSPYYNCASEYDSESKTWTVERTYEKNSSYFVSKYATPKSDGTSTIGMYYYRNGRRQTDNWDEGLINARMYHVQITSTSENYVLGIPRLDADGVVESSAENGRMVSPSFMIASQLGAVQDFSSVAMAASHCKHYVETYQENGETKIYDNWRLPTRSEIVIIMKYQKNSPDAMATVLTGSAYWSPEGPVWTETTTGNNGHTQGDIVPSGDWTDGWPIRCVRDHYVDKKE